MSREARSGSRPNRSAPVPGLVKRTVHTRPISLLLAFIEGEVAVDGWLHGEFDATLSSSEYRSSLAYCMGLKNHILSDAVQELAQLQTKTIAYETDVCAAIGRLSEALGVADGVDL